MGSRRNVIPSLLGLLLLSALLIALVGLGGCGIPGFLDYSVHGTTDPGASGHSSGSDTTDHGPAPPSPIPLTPK